MAKGNSRIELTTLEDILVDNQEEALNEKTDKRDKAKLSKSKQRKTILKSIKQLNAELQRSKGSTRQIENHVSSSISTDIGPRSSLKTAKVITLDFIKTGRKVKLVHYLGHLKNGSIAYSGVDTTTGQLFYVTEWQLKKSQIKQKCAKNGRCLWINNETTDCKSTEVDNLIATIEEQVTNLTQLKHKNLVHYECVLCVEHKRRLTIFLVEEFVCGESVSAMSAGGLVDWSIEGTRRVAKAVLRVLVYLHGKGFLYGQLLNNTVLFDNSRTIRCASYSVVSCLRNLIDHSSCATTEMSIQNDLNDLGKLVKSLISSKVDEVHDFIESCNTASFSSELLLHPFVNFPSDQPISSCISRFHSEYEMLMYLGSGAFGDVRKVRSTLDNRTYAIKRIPLIASPQLFKKMTREIGLLSCLKHENIVRYYSSWTENAQNDDIIEIEAAFSQGNESSENSSTGMNSSSSMKFDNFNKNKPHYDKKETPANAATTRISYMHILHIQMEFCDKRTLRNAIEENLSDNTERVWHLFNGIQQGISHIHQHGIIHRDLKPENIFLDFKGDIKIGDFGMATKEFCMKKRPNMKLDITNVTGKVGTSLYVAPELLGNAFESNYNHKVDMYAFGIILFEMIHPDFTTIMERVKVLSALRSSDVVVPISLLNNCKYDEMIKIIYLLLRHDPSHRPDTNHTEFLLLRHAALLQVISLNAKKLSK